MRKPGTVSIIHDVTVTPMGMYSTYSIVVLLTIFF